MVVEANPLPNHEIKVTTTAPAAVGAKAVAGFKYCWETQFSSKAEPEK